MIDNKYIDVYENDNKLMFYIFKPIKKEVKKFLKNMKNYKKKLIVKYQKLNLNFLFQEQEL